MTGKNAKMYKRLIAVIMIVMIVISGININNKQVYANDVSVEETAAETATPQDAHTTIYGNDMTYAPSDDTDTGVSVSYSVHAQTYGWLQTVADGTVAGTEGESKRLEAIKIDINNADTAGGITYSVHVQGIGWQDWISDGSIAGTEGQSKRVEAIRIKLYGEIENSYDVLYRAHVQGIGWQNWVKNGETAGTSGQSKRVEAIQVKLVEKKNTGASVTYTTHVQGIGWMNEVSNGDISGTSGQSRRLEALTIKLTGNDISGSVIYQTHVQGIGWQDWVSDGQISGTTGLSKRIEAIKINLNGDISAYYDIYYRVHTQNFGWLDWAKNGEPAGTSGLSRRLESLQVMLVKKGEATPTPVGKSYINGIEDIEGEYVIKVNKQMNCVTIYKGGIPVKAMVCSAGHATPLGTFAIGNQYRWRLMIHDVWSQWASVITTNILFHSVPYNERDNHTLRTAQYNKLGTFASAGCVRLTCEDAKWIYDNIDRGTTVIIYNSPDPGPLGKPTAQKLPLSQTWDPTDPNP